MFNVSIGSASRLGSVMMAVARYSTRLDLFTVGAFFSRPRLVG